jgi:DNA-binding NarL/FixJ family response regulator
MSEQVVVALVTDLMDRSRLTTALGSVRFARTPEAAADADVVVVDLARFADALSALRAALPQAYIVAFGPHVDDVALAAARSAGADAVMPRSRFFRDVAAAVAGA